MSATEQSLVTRPFFMPPDELCDDILLDLLRRLAVEVYPEPRLGEQRGIRLLHAAILQHRAFLRRHEHDLELALVQLVADDDLVAVPRQRFARLRDEQRLVCLELGCRLSARYAGPAERRSAP